jgi:hypothetical protein
MSNLIDGIKITAQPGSRYVYDAGRGLPALFSISVSSNPKTDLSYQWQVSKDSENWENISVEDPIWTKVNTHTMGINPGMTTVEHSGLKFRCEISADGYITKYSNIAKLKVSAEPVTLTSDRFNAS